MKACKNPFFLYHMQSSQNRLELFLSLINDFHGGKNGYRHESEGCIHLKFLFSPSSQIQPSKNKINLLGSADLLLRLKTLRQIKAGGSNRLVKFLT